MTATLGGRWQTRLFAVLVVGLVWTAVITPVLPAGEVPPGTSRLGDLYHLTLAALGLTALLGLVLWEPLYHLAQQFRWEKDWPAMFLLLQMIPEGALVHWVLSQQWFAMHVSPGFGLSWPAFTLDFGSTWIVIFAFLQGPMRVPFIRWRFRGGRLR